MLPTEYLSWDEDGQAIVEKFWIPLLSSLIVYLFLGMVISSLLVKLYRCGYIPIFRKYIFKISKDRFIEKNDIVKIETNIATLKKIAVEKTIFIS